MRRGSAPGILSRLLDALLQVPQVSARLPTGLLRSVVHLVRVQLANVQVDVVVVHALILLLHLSGLRLCHHVRLNLHWTRSPSHCIERLFTERILRVHGMGAVYLLCLL